MAARRGAESETSGVGAAEAAPGLPHPVAAPGARSQERAGPVESVRTANNARNRVYYRGTHVRGGMRSISLPAAWPGESGTIVVEDLHVAGMLRNRRLARAIADAGCGEIRRQLAYKTRWGGGRLDVADRWFPSSKTCSNCQAAKPKLPLRVPDLPLRTPWCCSGSRRSKSAARPDSRHKEP
jgi:hypothetical protein